MPASSICLAILPRPGRSFMMLPAPPIFVICFICDSRSLKSNWPFLNFSAIFSASSRFTVSTAFSTKDTTSPMPRIRLAIRSGWNGSSASHFSPIPNSLIGQPVTAFMDIAAPPRESPSTRVRTTPVTGTRSLNFSAVTTAS